MNRLPAALLFSGVLIGLAACQDSATTTTEPVALHPVLTTYPEFANDKHVMKLKDEGKKDAENAQKEARDEAKVKGGGAGTGIYYHGGSVLQSGTNVVAVYWASATVYPGGPNPGTVGSGASDGSLIGHFLRNLGGSPYFGINSSYTDGSGTAIANLVTYTNYWANNLNAPSPTSTASVSDAQMIAMLQSGFNSGKLTYNASTIYAIFTAGKANLGGGFGNQYCAYHSYATVTIGSVAKRILYAAMPYDNAYPTACSMQSYPNADPGADAEVNTLAHEIEEATTDMYLDAWYDRRGYENADKCAWTFGTTYSAGGYSANVNLGGKNFLIQQNWKNTGSGGCGMHL